MVGDKLIEVTGYETEGLCSISGREGIIFSSTLLPSKFYGQIVPYNGQDLSSTHLGPVPRLKVHRALSLLAHMSSRGGAYT